MHFKSTLKITSMEISDLEATKIRMISIIRIGVYSKNEIFWILEFEYTWKTPFFKTFEFEYLSWKENHSNTYSNRSFEQNYTIAYVVSNSVGIVIQQPPARKVGSTNLSLVWEIGKGRPYTQHGYWRQTWAEIFFEKSEHGIRNGRCKRNLLKTHYVI